jgi:hypothetical protein
VGRQGWSSMEWVFSPRQATVFEASLRVLSNSEGFFLKLFREMISRRDELLGLVEYFL